MKRKTVKTLIKWYEKNGRWYLPWRCDADPYRVLIAEILLRKTDAKKVSEIYPKIIKKFPSPKALMKANEKDLAKMLKPIGIYNLRAKQLKKLGNAVVNSYDSKIPEKEEDLISLPGVGKYTACAVQCFAFNKDVAIVDVNIIRTLSRIFGLKSKKARMRDDPEIWLFAQTLVPKDNAKKYNYALLDFSSAVCSSRKPKCVICPVKNYCAFAETTPAH